jgi:hypothetical protein
MKQSSKVSFTVSWGTKVNPSGRRVFKWTAIGFIVFLACAFVFLSVVAGGPSNVYGLVRYALPNMHRGDLHVGDRVRDVKLYALDGATTFRLRDRIGPKPLVLIFGSYT